MPFSASITNSVEPKTYKEANQSKEWLAAISYELAALEKLGTWTMVDIPPHVKPIGNTWVFSRLNIKLMVLLKGTRHG